MSDYSFPYKDAAFLINDVLDFDQMCLDAGKEDVNAEFASAVLEEAGRLGSEVLAPLNSIGDELGAKLEEDGVHETPGFADAYRQYVDMGWASLSGDEEYGGQAMPRLLAAAVVEIWDTANLAFSLCPLLTTGAIESIVAHGSDELKNTYLPNMISGEWAGSMCLTESAAGSDLAAVACKAVPEGDHYLITGQKIFITWGDHQMTENIIHLVLARLPDAPAGVRGISLFLVPKFLLDENGQPGKRNDAYCVGIEHKLGIHASPTCTLNFGDNGGAVGYLVGEAHNGLMAMFTMMNDARQGVGIQSLGVSERSYQQALAYAKERLQGTRSDGSRYPIIEFPDVRRMLMVMKASTEAMRGLIYIAADPHRQRLDYRVKPGSHLSGHPGSRWYGLCRGNRQCPVLPGCTHLDHLRGHYGHPGPGSGRSKNTWRQWRSPAGFIRRNPGYSPGSVRRRQSFCHGCIFETGSGVRRAGEGMVARERKAGPECGRWRQCESHDALGIFVRWLGHGVIGTQGDAIIGGWWRR